MKSMIMYKHIWAVIKFPVILPKILLLNEAIFVIRLDKLNHMRICVVRHQH
ncbi:hypothetical protein BLA29_012764 [Euroglyphus maynei]|uniref:Uncharacterized protein n=1 Tax=Euroglyphus maynei TaxID=6958 RepID=A0A1Y3BHU7_EURMA|nr:hypothetical protein BLA29_012764 [Euroglyphus maynei]